VNNTGADRIVEGSGNVFADLGLPDPGREMMKARLTLQIASILRQRGLTQVEAAKVLGIRRPHVSALVRNRGGNFSVERLMEFLTVLGKDVEIVVKPACREQDEMSVLLAEAPQRGNRSSGIAAPISDFACGKAT